MHNGSSSLFFLEVHQSFVKAFSRPSQSLPKTFSRASQELFESFPKAIIKLYADTFGLVNAV